MECLLFTVFTLVLICALFKGTESAGRREMPSIRYYVKLQSGRASENFLSPPWGHWFLDVSRNVPTFVSERPRIEQEALGQNVVTGESPSAYADSSHYRPCLDVGRNDQLMPPRLRSRIDEKRAIALRMNEEWTPIALLKLIDGAMHVILMAGRDPDNDELPSYHRLPSSGSGLLMVQENIWRRSTSVFHNVDETKLDTRPIIDLITFPCKDLKQHTISIQNATPMPMDYRSSIPVYTTIVLHEVYNMFNDMWIYQTEAGQLIDVSRVFGLDYSYTEKYTSEVGDIIVTYPKGCLRFDRVDEVELKHPLKNGVTVWISKNEEKLFSRRSDGAKVFLDDNQDSAR